MSASDDKDVVDIAGVSVRLKINPRARRISLRLDIAAGCAVLSRPKGVSRQRALDFAHAHEGWLIRQAKKLGEPVPVVDGADLPYAGRQLRLESRPQARRGVWLEDDILCVSGRAEHLPRRVRDWIKEQALRTARAGVARYTQQLGVPCPRVAVRDPRTRWGSCSARGGINFSWRLVMAPPEVFDYVVAHEVSHLKEANHGPDFWALVEELYGSDWSSRRAWLHAHGTSLHRVSF